MCESIEQNEGRVIDWDNVQWDIPKQHVRRLQERILRATRDKDWAKFKNLQNLLVRSHSARLLAVKRVTQENKGKYKPGIDGQIYITSMERLFGAENSKGNYTTPSNRSGENKRLNLIRYADDFVATAPSREKIISYVLPRFRTFLKERGMKLNEAKTKIVHRDDGFDFLGFIIRQYHGKAHNVCLTRPSKKAFNVI